MLEVKIGEGFTWSFSFQSHSEGTLQVVGTTFGLIGKLQRKKTLLEEYKRRNKTNQFVDLRFGEYDETLSAEEKMMRRFMLEKQVIRHLRAVGAASRHPTLTCRKSTIEEPCTAFLGTRVIS